MSSKLLTLATVSSVVTTLSPAVVLGIPWLVICVVAFPFVFFSTLAFVYIGNRIFCRYSIQKLQQVFIILPLGFFGGLVVYFLLFSRNMFNSGLDGLSLPLLMQYSLLGLYAAIVTWVLYNFGPFSLVPDHSNKALQSDAAEPRR
jgi:hypothetical protein